MKPRREWSLILVISMLFISQFNPHPVQASGDRDGSGASFGKMDVYFEDNITTDTFWGPESSPVVINRTISVISGATLWIFPGTIVEFGKGASLIINGTLNAGGEGSSVDMRPSGSLIKGSWEGLLFGPGSRGILERVDLTGANISFSLVGPQEFVLRNSTIQISNITFVLDSGARARVYNSTLDHSGIRIRDNGSEFRTFALLSALVVDHLGSPRGDANVEIFDHMDIMRLSFIVNSTGEVPPLIFEGSSFIKGGRNETAGTYKISIQDSPFTHFVNYTYVFNGTIPRREVLRYTWPPELSSVPARMNIFEDALAYHYSRVLDRNNAGSVTVHASTPSVRYNRTLERIEFLYTDEAVGFEIVNLTLDDGYDRRTYSIEVNITPVNDPFTMEFSESYLHPVENIPYDVEVFLSDEDTPIREIDIWTDDPANTTYDPARRILTLLYGDGTDPEFKLTVNATDGRTNRSREFIVYFQPVHYPPYFKGVPVDVELEEDTTFTMDLSPYIFDDDKGEVVSLSANVDEYEVFSARVEGNVLYIEPYKDMNGHGTVNLLLRDQADLTGYALINVTVQPVDDEPLLSYPEVEVIDQGIFRFSVNYSDIDGDMPDGIFVDVSGVLYGLSLVPREGLDPVNGLNYSRVLELKPGTYRINFKTHQGTYDVNISLPDLIVDEIIRTHILESYLGSLNVTLWTVGVGTPLILTPEIEPVIIGNLQPLGCIFRFQFGELLPRKAYARVSILEFRKDIIPASTVVFYLDQDNWTLAGPGSYERSTGRYSIILEGEPLNSTIGIWAELDDEYDTDGDGIKNLMDAFPDDPDEWNDTDRDGTGDNADEDDDDDGFNDLTELQAGTDPRSSSSYPRDTDTDGILDYIDLDDDGDGIPDEWESNYDLDPMDPSDAYLDPDGDGRSNLEEYLAGGNPLVDERGVSDPPRAPIWLIIIVALVLMVLVIAVLALLLKSRDEYKEEWKDDEEDWEIQGELDPGEAMDCDGCGEIFPIWLESCPRCGWKNYLVEE